MREVIHRVSGGLAALCAAALVAFATDGSTRPSSWAVPATIAVVVSCAVIWLLTRIAREDGKVNVAPRQSLGKQNVLTHTGEGNVVGRDQNNYYGTDTDRANSQSEHAAALRTADKETFEDLVAMVPRHIITFLEEHDFGASWFDDQTLPLYEYRQTRNAVEHRFHDEVLEERRRALYAAVEELTRQLAQYSGPSEHGRHYELSEKQWTRSHPPGDKTYDRYEAHRNELNKLADRVVAAYNGLVEKARRRVP
jgi:hypothetical protein